jgi:hypothetical protein
MSDFFLLALLSFATYRLFRLLAWDTILDGPRTRLLGRELEDYTAKEPVYSYRRPRFEAFLRCPWCLGFWLSGLVVGIADFIGSVRLPGFMWLAVSVIVGLIDGMD